MLSTLIALLVLGGIVYSYVKASLKPTRISPDELNLTSVREAVMEKLGWTAERAEAAQTEYKRFLTLLQKKPGFLVVPWSTVDGHDDLDQFWHQHILDTAKYAVDCDRVFGYFIHHNPHVVRGSEQESNSVLKTQRLYARTFDSGIYGSSVDPIFLTGCSSCGGSPDGDSCSDSGHGDGGHGCGSHGCGTAVAMGAEAVSAGTKPVRFPQKPANPHLRIEMWGTRHPALPTHSR